MADYLPRRDSELLGFADNFSIKITAAPTAFGVTAAQATAFGTLFTNFDDALRALQDPQTKSPYYTEAKNAAREALVDGPGGIRELVALVQAHPAITDQQLIDLRLTVRDREPTPVPAPSAAPVFIIRSQVGRVVECRLADAEDIESRARAAGATGASVLMFVGEEAPTDPLLWTLAKNVSGTQFELELPASIPGGARVWFSAFWFNQRKDNSPPATPVSVRVGDTLAMAA